MGRWLLFILPFLIHNTVSAQSLNLYADTLHKPFIYGVASGDPTTNAVIIWSAVEEANPTASDTLLWQLSTDSVFGTGALSGQIITDSSKAFTAKTDVTGLQPGTRYYYRFQSGNRYSALGITYTAPTSAGDSVSMALVSCSSLFSGYFNAYRRMAEKKELRAIIHVGDYIYDFVDPDEQIRVPANTPSSLASKNDWRNQHRLYLQDPDLREARRVLPFIYTWDNHDLERNSPLRGAQAFAEFAPVRFPDNDPIRIWRKIAYGGLLDIFMIDMNIYGGKDTFPSGTKKAVNDAQFNWLLNGLDSSGAIWKVIGSEKMFSAWDLKQYASFLPGSGLDGTWSGYTESRDSLLAFVERKNINNLVVGSGDLHMSIWSDLTRNPFDTAVYNGTTGAGGLGVEVMGTSISRGNLDESGVGKNLAPMFYKLSYDANPQQQYLNLFDHGYTVLTFTKDSMTSKAYLNPILSVSGSDTLESFRTVLTNTNHWKREKAFTAITDPKDIAGFSLYPNPAKTAINIASVASEQNPALGTLTDMQGKVLWTSRIDKNFFSLSLSNINAGVYLFRLENKNGSAVKKFIKQ
jgi:alkaline phosphatase D